MLGGRWSSRVQSAEIGGLSIGSVWIMGGIVLDRRIRDRLRLRLGRSSGGG